jgi:hypothetical protein
MVVGAIAIALALSSCAWLSKHPVIGGSSKSKPKPNHDGLLAVTAEKTPFYELGPQQGRGPDRELTRDTVVTVIRHSWGYSKVKLEDGKQGFVANDDLGQAPERLIAQLTTSHEDVSDLPPPPPVKLPTSDNSPEFEPTPIPRQLMPQ